MTVLLVLSTFVIFLLIDYFRTRHTAVQPALQMSTAKQDAAAPRLQPALVGGFAVPENLRYHPGHTWALSESPNLVRVGMDDFASKLTGTVESFTLPQRGQWIRQGQKLCTIHRDGGMSETSYNSGREIAFCSLLTVFMNRATRMEPNSAPPKWKKFGRNAAANRQPSQPISSSLTRVPSPAASRRTMTLLPCR